ncbi:MAG: hypothetical protein IVW57_13895, partial [Ktedonobacterales bacterium]|nr:hypothetical protein [Ktedonobacterales bacterium]
MREMRWLGRLAAIRKVKRRGWLARIMLGMVLVLFMAGAVLQPQRSSLARAANTSGNTAGTVTFWLQQVDSCKAGVPGASYQLTDSTGTVLATGTTLGDKPRTVYPYATASCLIQRANCTSTMPRFSGCLSFALPILTSGSVTYTITETQAATGPGFGYIWCFGGSGCSVPERLTVVVTSAGIASATVYNVYPNGQSVVWPNDGGAPYTGTTADPAVPHNSGLGTLPCDGDGDIDDHTGGSEGYSLRCDNDNDYVIAPPPTPTPTRPA